MSGNDGFRTLYEAHVDALFTHAYFRVSDREIAKDIVQDVFVRAWNVYKNGGEDAVVHWRAFLYTMLNNKIIDHYRSKKRTEVSLDSVMERGDDEGSEYVPEALRVGGLEVESERFDTTLSSQVVRDAVGQLPEHDRQIVVLRYLNEESVQDVAKMLNMTENAVYVRSHRALARLKRLLSARSDHIDII